MDQSGPVDSSSLFRAPKRRKVFRTRSDHEDDAQRPSTTTTTTTPAAGLLAELAGKDQDVQTEDNSLASILRQSRLQKIRRGGIDFAQARTVRRNPTEMAVTVPEPAGAPTALAAAVDRFATETGQQVVSNDSVMMEYIDSEIARMRAGEAQSNVLDANSSNPNSTNTANILRQPATIGKLMEIDLGPDATLTNTARTEAARLRSLGHAQEEEASKPEKVRLGRDGKPRRKRWRRASDDLKRDAIVEAVMKESKLDVYDEPDEPVKPGDGVAADDFLAEQFQREYMEAAQNRNNMKKAPTASSTKGKVEEKAKGPKLGGSRSTRAAYHAQEKAAAAAAAAAARR